MPRRLNVNGRQLHCVHPRTATPINAERAIAYSCNCAIAHWSARASIADLSSALNARSLHVQGPVTGICLLALGEEGLRISPLELLGCYQHLHPPDDEQPQPELTGNLRHEMTHAVLEQNAASSLPEWFREGLAKTLCGKQGRTEGRRVHDSMTHYGQPAVLSWVEAGLPPPPVCCGKIAWCPTPTRV